MRKPNIKCSVCETPIYRRPNEIKKFSIFTCSPECRKLLTDQKIKICPTCKVDFKPSSKKSKFCSRSCSNKSRKGSAYLKQGFSNKSQRRLAILKEAFAFESCMVVGCTYNKVYEIHRFLPGRKGGEYIIGNMFAICPNHHAEIERKIVSVSKINNHTLECLPLATVSALEKQ